MSPSLITAAFILGLLLVFQVSVFLLVPYLTKRNRANRGRADCPSHSIFYPAIVQPELTVDTEDCSDVTGNFQKIVDSVNANLPKSDPVEPSPVIMPADDNLVLSDQERNEFDRLVQTFGDIEWSEDSTDKQ